MMARSLAPLALLVPLVLTAQWQTVPVPVTSNLFSIDGFDEDRLCIGTVGSWLGSTDGGATWVENPMVDPQGFPLLGSVFHAMRYQSPVNIVGTGFFFLDTYPFQVRRSVNGGINWPTVYDQPGNGQFTTMRGMAFSANNGVAVGDLGRIIRTSNSGASWTTSSTSGGTLRDVAWVNSTTVVAVGEGIIRRSTNSGQTWTFVASVNQDLHAVSFPSGQVGYAAGTGGVLLRSADGGATWSAVPLQYPGIFPNISDLWFVNENEGYAAAGPLILRTTNGGQHWSWYDAGGPLRRLHFRTPTNGFAVGDDGLLLRTVAGAYRPFAVIGGPSGSVCHNVPVTFTDESGPGLTRQWLVNGQPVGTDPTLEWTFTEPSQMALVALVVDNGIHTDTLVRAVQVSASLAAVNNATMASTTVCSGLSANVTVPGSQQGTSYRLWRGTTAVGNAQNGNGGTLTFPTGAINAPQVFHLVATRNILFCGTSIDTVSFNITLGNPQTTLAVLPGAVTVCLGDTLTITLEASEPGVIYQLRRNGTNVGVPQTGTGNALDFVQGPLTTNATYTVFATNTQTGCNSTLQQSVPVNVQELRLNWGADAMNPIAGTPVHLMNGTNVPQSSFTWTIPGGVPASSTSAEVEGVVFALPGAYPVKLRGITPIGCRDSLVQVLHVVEQPAPQECGVSQLNIKATNPNDGALAMDAMGNMYGFFHASSAAAIIAFSGGADTLLKAMPNAPNYGYNSVLLKFDPQGMPQWVVNYWHNSTSARHADVVVDEWGNVYAAYFHNEHTDSLRLVDASGTRTTINPPHSSSGGSTQYSVVITSFTPQGRLRWMSTFLGHYTLEEVVIKLDGLGNLWVMHTDRLVKFDRDSGTQVLQVPQFGGFRDITVTADNEIWVTDRANMVMRKYANNGALLQTTPSIQPTPPPFGLTRLNGRLAARDPAGNIYQLHNIQGQVVLGSDTLTGPGTNTSNQYYVYFLARRDQAGGIVWTRTLEMDGNILPQGLVATGDRVYLLVRFSTSDTLRMQGLDPIPFGIRDTWMLSYDLNGGTPHAIPIYTHINANLGTAAPNRNSLVTSEDGQRLAMWVGFHDPLWAGDDTAFSYTWSPPPNVSPKNYGLVFGAIDCLMPGLPASENIPQASFTAPEGNCINQPLQFMDASLFNPTAWSWSFPGGVPATSTDASPVVSYALPGSYPVTLIASNAFGQSAPFTTEVFVDICTAVPSAGADGAWRVWPVPTMDQVNVRGPAPATGSVVDIQGRVVWRGTVPAQGTIDLGGLPPGAYLLQVDGARLRILKQ